MKILITHPDLQTQGGISNYYDQLQGKFNMPVQYFVVGKRAAEKGFFSFISRTFVDYWRFVKCLRNDGIDLVLINPALELKCFIRDGIFALLARVNKKKTVVFFRGWRKSFEVCIESHFLWVFKLLFGKSAAFIILSDEFKKTLEKWGVAQPIYKEVTIINEDDLIGFDIQNALKERQNSEKWRILFLAGVTRRKGIYETVQAVSLLQTQYPMIELIIAGDGYELGNVKSYVKDHNMSGVTFLGRVRNKDKRRAFERAHIYCLPSYSEGLPNSVVEAMAFGLPVITRPVGGLADLFKNKEYGFISDSLDPNVFASLIKRLFVDKNLYNKISLSNYQYAQSHFLACDAALRLEKIYKIALEDRKK